MRTWVRWRRPDFPQPAGVFRPADKYRRRSKDGEHKREGGEVPPTRHRCEEQARHCAGAHGAQLVAGDGSSTRGGGGRGVRQRPDLKNGGADGKPVSWLQSQPSRDPSAPVASYQCRSVTGAVVDRPRARIKSDPGVEVTQRIVREDEVAGLVAADADARSCEGCHVSRVGPGDDGNVRICQIDCWRSGCSTQ